MSSEVVLDASFLVAMVTAQEKTQVVRSLWSQWKERDVQLLAPSLLLLEAGTGIRKYVVAGVLNEADGLAALLALAALVEHMSLTPVEQLVMRAWEIARQYRLMNLYDATYVALGDKFGCDLWTLDARMRRAMPGHAARIHVISIEA